MSWLDKIIPGANKSDGALKRGVPEGLWLKCPSCDAVLYTTDVEKNQHVCMKCSYHMRISTSAPISLRPASSSRPFSRVRALIRM